jgi:3'-5' exoribonuclease
MKRENIAELRIGTTVESVYLVRSWDLKKTRDGKAFITMELGDRTGSIKGIKWDASADAFNEIKVGDFIAVRGRVTSYKNDNQIDVGSFYFERPDRVDPGEFMRAASRPGKEILADLKAELDKTENPWLRRLLDAYWRDKTFVDAFSTSTAAVKMHHAYVSGLVEHTLSVVRVGAAIAEHYRTFFGPDAVDLDMVRVGLFLHDLGKTIELQTGVAFSYTDPGQLLGHITLGVLMIQEKCASIPGFPDELRTLLQHQVLAHHGQLEYGSPKVPMTIEAYIIHTVENLDAKVENFVRITGEAANQPGNWTGWEKMFETSLFRGYPDEITGRVRHAGKGIATPPVQARANDDDTDEKSAPRASKKPDAGPSGKGLFGA